ncbi:MAG: hypothetical protein WCD20_20075 [Rhodomicrobium sp.]
MKTLLAIGAVLLIVTPSLAAHRAKHDAGPFKPGTFLPGAPPVFWLPDGRAVHVGANGKVVDMKKDKCYDRFNPYHAPGWC